MTGRPARTRPDDQPRAAAAPPAPGALPGAPGGVRARAAALAALVTLAAFCLGDAVARSYPFGFRTRSVNDLGNQFVPFHAHLWDLLHGRGSGGLFLNWQSGYGASFLPDLGTYLGSPFALLVALFPRDEIDLAVYVITLLKMAVAGAVMAQLLLTLRPGRWWAAGALGASYALCGWSVAEASYNPMWLDGLIALPLLCLVGHWALAGRRFALGAVLVALVWIANFYTAYMATLGAVLLLLTRLLVEHAPTGVPLRQRLAPLWRPVTRLAGVLALGVGLAAPMVSVVYFGTKHAYPGRVVEFSAKPWADVLARLLPGTYNFSSPAVYVDTVALLLALTLPFNPAVPRRLRGGWTLLVAGVTLSLQWGPTQLAWHAFSVPNGSQYRETFVLCGLLVTAAWLSFAHGTPGRRPLLAAGALLAVIAAAAAPATELIRPWTYPLLLAGVAAVAASLLLARLARRHRHPLLAALAVVLLIGAQVGQSAATTAVADRLRLGHLDDYAPWGQRQQTQRELIADADGWPRYRTDPGREQTVGNDPLLVGGQGAQYYSSLTADVLSRTLTALGGGWTSRGRSVQSLDNPVTDAIFSVGARVHSAPDPHRDPNATTDIEPYVTREAVPPLVTVRPDTKKAPVYGSSPFRNQELLLGARVYTLPGRISIRGADGRPAARTPDGGYRLPPGPTEQSRPKALLTATCPGGSQVFLWAPHYWGVAALRGADRPPVGFRGDHPVTKIAPMQPLGKAPASGRVEVQLTVQKGGTVPAASIGCLDTGRLRAATDRLRAQGATAVQVSDSGIRAELPAGSRGIAVVAAPRIAGWRCAAGSGGDRPADSYLGLIAVRLDGSATSIDCTFRPPGLRLGTAVGAAALLALTLPAAYRLLRNRRESRHVHH
ncbi:YfhO family protein [Streptomyces sp. ME19-01-6]|uniref:YfhO family protein n=1 Tax=Streptomyces sp. ME19-01-6 TaxID=3028686 RepID=UPI00299FF01A|nr:YfhO family protein [Streptomyces sp. ME19-01-6]MDX3228050.1 YfhO family protein [Streptomyces sp. ME19-01-6]